MKRPLPQFRDSMEMSRRDVLRGIGAVALGSAAGRPAQGEQAPVSVEENSHGKSPDSSLLEYLKRSFASGREYFVLRSGSIQLIVQRDTFDLAPAILLLAFDARESKQSGSKENALNFEQGEGFLRSALGVRLGGFEFTALGHETEAQWVMVEGVPAVEARWWAGGILVREQIRALDDAGTFQRRVILESKNMGGPEQVEVLLRLPMQSGHAEDSWLLGSQARYRIRMKADHVSSRVDPGEGTLRVRPVNLAPGDAVSLDSYLVIETAPSAPVSVTSTLLAERLSRTQARWKRASMVDTRDTVLHDLFQRASFALSGMVADDGTMDAGIFEYGGQWVRDTSNTAVGLLHAGHFELARAALAQIFNKMIGNDGSTMIYGGFDEVDREELDQMGELLLAIRAYVDWTGDEAFVTHFREKIIATVNRPLEAKFRHSSGLVHGRREFWERTTSDGLESVYQVYLVLGLESAISLASLLRVDASQVNKWQLTAKTMRQAALHDQHFSIIQDGRILKRRSVDGQPTRELDSPMNLPDVPVQTERVHLAEPDSVTALPIALGFVEPQSSVATSTLEFLDRLWNARWFGGGYERYHSSSQPDQPGPWPFANCFILRAQHDARMYERSRRTLQWLHDVQGGNTGGWFEEIPIVRSQAAKAGILPWTSAEITLFAVRHVLGVRFDNNRLTIRPNVYPDSPAMVADLRFRSRRLNISVPGAKFTYAVANGQKMELDRSGALTLPENIDGGKIEFRAEA